MPNIVLLVTARDGDVDAPAVAAAGTALTDELAAEAGVADVVSYWSEGNAPPLRNDDGSRALVVARIEGDDDQVEDRIDRVGAPLRALRRHRRRRRRCRRCRTGRLRRGVPRGRRRPSRTTCVRAETIALPITLVLLILVFGSVVAASLPLAIGVLSIVGTFFVLRCCRSLTEVSVFALNLTTAMGLGLAIDYCLFIVSRYREELRARDTRPASP